MVLLATAITILAAGDRSAVGRHISKGAGIGIIIGTVIAAAIAVALVCWLVMALLRGPVARRSHRRGHVGRV
ncbi:MAG TPA: hypothetical protein VGN69_09025 [Solirubrobacteraceae bacterium]|jgi:tellurite resistance protein TehA-like permease|nr:hypothetical protein [Solirubrobacteraceae bacterium]